MHSHTMVGIKAPRKDIEVLLPSEEGWTYDKFRKLTTQIVSDWKEADYDLELTVLSIISPHFQISIR